jgi:uncharacterized membrane protein YkvA (DUF1232 family)
VASDTPADAGGDPFPGAAFKELIGRLPRYARLAWRLGRDDRLPSWRRAALLAGAAYLASPIDLVPGIIPVAGQLDDAAAVILALKLALGGLPNLARQKALAETGLTRADLDADLRTIGATYGWIGRRGGRLAWRGVRAAARTGARLGARVVRRTRG